MCINTTNEYKALNIFIIQSSNNNKIKKRVHFQIYIFGKKNSVNRIYFHLCSYIHIHEYIICFRECQKIKKKKERNEYILWRLILLENYLCIICYCAYCVIKFDKKKKSGVNKFIIYYQSKTKGVNRQIKIIENWRK